jgi:DUF917 family protein
MPLIDFYGNVVIVQEAVDPTYPDQIGRYIVTHGGGLGANNHYPMTGKQAKQAVIPNTISGALRLGRSVLNARQESRDPIAAIEEALGGRLLHVGEITAMREEESLGFYFTTASIAGHGPSKGHRGDLIIKNETMMLSVDGEPKAYFPDLVLLLEPDTGRGLMSVELDQGTPVALVGVPCHPRLRRALSTPLGEVAFSPARYGCGQHTFTPIEQLVPEFSVTR